MTHRLATVCLQALETGHRRHGHRHFPRCSRLRREPRRFGEAACLPHPTPGTAGAATARGCWDRPGGTRRPGRAAAVGWGVLGVSPAGLASVNWALTRGQATQRFSGHLAGHCHRLEPDGGGNEGQSEGRPPFQEPPSSCPGTDLCIVHGRRQLALGCLIRATVLASVWHIVGA